MDESIKAPLVHGRMIYRCENCGQSWFMYLEKGIEEFGENHKPSPFTICCPYCGGWAMDVSGIQKIPGGGYMPLPDRASYFANKEDRDYGVPVFYSGERKRAAARKMAMILLADELDRSDDEEAARAAANMAAETEEEARKIEEAARIFAERAGVSLEQAVGEILNVMQRLAYLFDIHPDPMEESGEFLDFPTAWDRKEARQKRRAVERATASRFRQHKARESAWAVQKRTGHRQREWRGPWKGQ